MTEVKTALKKMLATACATGVMLAGTTIAVPAINAQEATASQPSTMVPGEGVSKKQAQRLITGAAGNAAITQEALDSIDKDHWIRLSVYKAFPNPNDDKGSSIKKPADAAGAIFTLTKVPGVDLTDAAALAKFADEKKADDIAKLGLPVDYTATTNNEGLAFFDVAEPGVYLLQEKQRPEYAKDHDVRYAMPLLLTLPLRDIKNESWEYDPWINPKNALPSWVVPTAVISSVLLLLIPAIVGLWYVFQPVPAAPVAPKPADTANKPPQKGVTKSEKGTTKEINKAALADTGAAVKTILGVGVLALLMGIVLLLARRRKGEAES